MSDLMTQLQAELLAKGGHAHLLSRAVELGLGAGSVYTDVPVSNLLVAYSNRDLIADRVMPVVRAARRSGKYRKLKPETHFQIPDALLGSQEAMPNRAAYALDSDGTFAVKDYALLDFISHDEEAGADAPIEPRLIAEKAIMGFLSLAREKRCADLVFAAGQYGSNTEALAGGDRWDNSASDPVAKLLTRLRTPLVRPDTMVIGEEAWDAFRTHAAVTKYITSRNAADGINTPLMVDEPTVARAFRLRQVLVGTPIYNTAREGATPSYSRIWGKSCALIKVQETPSPRETATFGYTFRFTGGMPPFAVQAIAEQLRGVRGGTWLKISHSDDEVVVGGDKVGYLLTTVVS